MNRELVLYHVTEKVDGIDKTIVKSIIDSFDYDRFKEVPGKVLDTTGYTMPVVDCETGQLIDVSTIEIEDEYVRFTSKVCIKNNEKLRVNRLSLNRKNNLYPYDIGELKEAMKKAHDYIKENYYISLNDNSLKGHCMEVNTNIKLDRSYSEYNYVLEAVRLICSGGTHRLKAKAEYAFDGTIETLYLNNSNIELKFYNKTLELARESQIYIADEVMRIELKLKNQDSIQYMFDTHYLECLTDEQIKEKFYEFLKLSVFDKIDAHIEKSKVKIEKITKKEKERLVKKPYIASTISSILTTTVNKKDLFIDCDFLVEVIKKLDKNHSRTIKRNAEEIKKLTKFSENYSKFMEIKNKIFN